MIQNTDVPKGNEIKELFLKGAKIAMAKLIAQKKRDDSKLAIMENGKVLIVRARDLPDQ